MLKLNILDKVWIDNLQFLYVDTLSELNKKINH